MISSSYNVIQSVAKDLKSVSLCIQIIPPFSRLDDKMFRNFILTHPQIKKAPRREPHPYL